MKILEVIPALTPGGAERFVVDLCNQMAIDGHEVSLLTMKDLGLEKNGFYKCNISLFSKFYRTYNYSNGLLGY